MPVEDHEIHPATRHTDLRYTACQEKVRNPSYPKLVTVFPAEANPYQHWTLIADAGRTGCCYMDYETDAGCTGCKQPKNLEYIDKMKGLK